MLNKFYTKKCLSIQLVVLNILNLIDTGFTYYFTVLSNIILKLDTGYYVVSEGNPLMDYLLKLDPNLFIITKISILIGFTIILYDSYSKSNYKIKKRLNIFIFLLNFLYLVININHLQIYYLAKTVGIYI